MKLPHTIENYLGEKLIFHGVKTDVLGSFIDVENAVEPGAGPPFHVHYRQEESLTVTAGRIGYQILGSEEKHAGIGETVVFKAGQVHRFWNAGSDVLRCRGYVRPPDNFIYFLSNIYASINVNKNGQPGTLDAAFLLTRYKNEFGMPEIPVFVQRVIFPVALFFGRITGKLEKFKDAPPPLD